VLILASSSPRRRQLLESAGIDFRAVEPDVEELTEGRPEEVVVENARRKALAGLDRAADGDLVLGSDTEVVLDGRVLGKAEDERGARAHLETLSGRTHTVLTSIVLVPASRAGEERWGVERAEVTFRDLEKATLDLYLGSGEWRGRAGAYAIQGLGAILVDRLEGDFSAVIGLSLRLLFDLAPELVPRR
jgi:septum formation protein